MRYSGLALLACVLSCVGCQQPSAPLVLTEEERKVVEVAQDHLARGNLKWETPVKVTPPPNRVNVPDWQKYVEEEGNIWRIVYHTPEDEVRTLGPRTLFVNMRTKEALPSMRK